MNIHYAILAGLLVFSSAALAADDEEGTLNPKLQHVSKDLLDTSLISYSTCIGVDIAGLAKLEKIAKAEQAEPSNDHQRTNAKIEENGEELVLRLRPFMAATNGIRDTLVKWHNGNKEDLDKQSMDVAQTAHDEMAAQLKDVSDFAEFQEKFESAMQKCKKVTDELDKKIGDAMEALDINQ